MSTLGALRQLGSIFLSTPPVAMHGWSVDGRMTLSQPAAESTKNIMFLQLFVLKDLAGNTCDGACFPPKRAEGTK